jgi:hypothetical protein
VAAVLTAGWYSIVVEGKAGGSGSFALHWSTDASWSVDPDAVLVSPPPVSSFAPSPSPLASPSPAAGLPSQSALPSSGSARHCPCGWEGDQCDELHAAQVRALRPRGTRALWSRCGGGAHACPHAPSDPPRHVHVACSSPCGQATATCEAAPSGS